MTAFFGPRAGAESAFIVAVAVLAYLLELSFTGVVAAIFGAWFVVAVFEVVASRKEAVEKAGRSREEAASGELEAVVGEAEPLPPLLPSRDEAPPPRPAPQRLVRPGPAVEEREATGAPADEAETIAVTPAPPPPPPTAALLPAPVAPPAPPPPAATPPARIEPRRPREWNLWELERAARELAGRDPVRDEERSFLLMYLREFADAEGNLPEEFDGLVRDSFADLLAAGR